MNLAYLLTGGNMGVRADNLQRAANAVHAGCGNVLQSSPLFETAAWGIEEQPAFLNQALLVQTHLAPEQLLQCLLHIERQMGREREEKYGPRIIDIDLLLYNQLVYQSEHLSIPHPQLPRRRFALTCLHQIAPLLRHPQHGQTITDLLASCPDPLGVKNYSPTNNTL